MKGWHDMNLDNLTPEQIEQAKTLRTTEELVKYAMENGVELTDEQLEDISGGGWGDIGSGHICPASPDKKHRWVRTGNVRPADPVGIAIAEEYEYRCTTCGKIVWDSPAFA